MSKLAELQTAFMAQVVDNDAPLPEGWGERHAAGMNVYRGNYRTALVESLCDTYQKTLAYVGDAPFKQASIHHLIKNPPTSFTLDDAGAGFAETCAELFANAPEVAELAWLEWEMIRGYSSPDVEPLDAAGFSEATARFDETDWAQMRLEFVPSLGTKIVGHDLRVIWKAIDQEGAARPDLSRGKQHGVVTWREEEQPTFIMIKPEEVTFIEHLQGGASYGEACVALAGENAGAEQMQQAALAAGKMLGRWLQDGVILRVSA